MTLPRGSRGPAPAQIVVRLDDTSRSILDHYAGPEGYGSTVREAIATYAEVCRTALPRMRPDEWRALAALYASRATAVEMAASLSDQHAEMARRMSAWSRWQVIAVQSALGRFTARAKGWRAEQIRQAGGDPAAVPSEPGWRE